MCGFMAMLRKAREREDSGFTLVEVLVVSGIFLMVLSLLLTTLEIAVRQERRTTAIVDNQFRVMNALQSMTREIRGANPIETAGVATSEDMRFALTVSNGSVSAGDRATWRFLVDGQGRLLQQKIEGGAVAFERLLVRQILNTQNQPLFRYFDEDHEELTTTGADQVLPSVIAQCTVRVVIDVISASDLQGAPPYRATTDVQVRNKLPGGTGC